MKKVKSKKVKKGGCCIISTLFGVKSSKGTGKSYFNSSRLPVDLQKDFTIQTNHGNGDCFFLSLSQGLATVGANYSVNELRQIVLDNISFKTYNTNMWEYYISKEIIGTGVTAYFNKMYTPFTPRQTDLINQIKATNNNDDVIHLTNQLIVESTNTSNENKFKKFILSNNYWADISAIEILSNGFNLHFVIFKSSNKKIECILKNDYDKKEYKYYICIWWSDPVHYELMPTHQGIGYFTYDTLPYIIKSKICESMKQNKLCNNDANFTQKECNIIQQNNTNTIQQNTNTNTFNSASLYLFRIKDNLLQLLVCLRGVSDNYGKIYTMGGQIDKGETPEQAAIRESKEEAGVIINVNQINKDPIIIKTHPAFYAILSETDEYDVKGPTSGHEWEIQNDAESYNYFMSLPNTNLCYTKSEDWTGWAWVDINIIYNYIKEKKSKRDNYIVAKVITELVKNTEINRFIIKEDDRIKSKSKSNKIMSNE